MKICLLIIFLSISISGKSQENSLIQSKHSKIEFGLLFSQIQNTFGTGISLTSMHLKDRRINIRFRGNFMFDKEENFNTFLGLTNVSDKNKSVFLYAEGGLYGTTKTFLESNNYAVGIYALIGLDICILNQCNAFVEAGTTGTNELMNYLLNAGIRIRI